MTYGQNHSRELLFKIGLVSLLITGVTKLKQLRETISKGRRPVRNRY